MNTLLIIRRFVFVTLLLYTGAVLANVPNQMNYQFLLTDSLGNAVPDGNYSVTFVIFSDSVSGDTIWSEGRLVTANNGLVSVVLGEIVPIPDTTFRGQNRWLGVQVGLDKVIVPRTRLASFQEQSELLVVQVGLDPVIVPTTPHTSPQRQENTSSKKNVIPKYEVVAVNPNGHKIFIVTQATKKSQLNSIVRDYKRKHTVPNPPWMINFFSDKKKALRVKEEWLNSPSDDSYLDLWVYNENVDHSAIAQWTSWDGVTLDKW